MMFRESLALAMRQLIHRGRQSAAALAGVSVAIVLMFMQLGFQNALYTSATKLFTQLDGQIVLTSPLYRSMLITPTWFPLSAVVAARAVPGVEFSRPLYAASSMLLDPKFGSIGAWILGINLDHPALKVKGLSVPLETLRIPNTALLDQKSRNAFAPLVHALDAGRHPDLRLYSPSLPLATVFSLRGTFKLGPTFTMDGLILTSDLSFSRILDNPLDRVFLGAVKVKPGANPRHVAAELRKTLAGRASVYLKGDLIAQEKHYYSAYTPIGVIFNMGLLVGLVVGAVFISQVLHSIIDANIKEYAVLITMGYPSVFLTLIVLEIAVAITLITFFPSVGIAAVLYHVAAQATHLPLQLTPASVAGIFAMALAMGCIAALFAMRRIRLANPLDLFS